MVLNHKADILYLAENSADYYSWGEKMSVWIDAEWLNKTSFYSKIGMGARSVTFSMRPCDITLNNYLLWDGKYYIPTSITRPSIVLMEVVAAQVTIYQCKATFPDDNLDELKRPKYQSGTGDVFLSSFPAILTEKYIGFVQDSPMALTEQRYVMITPKIIMLQAGNLVEIESVGKFAVERCYILDEFMNEYEIVRKDDA